MNSEMKRFYVLVREIDALTGMSLNIVEVKKASTVEEDIDNTNFSYLNRMARC